MGRPASDIRPRLIAAARTRFLADGVDGASLRAIASDARTNIGMVYYYFPTKDDLFFAVVEDVYAALLADLAEALAPDVAVDERLRRLYRRLGAMSETEATTVRLILRELLVSNERLRQVIERFQRGHIPLVLQAIRDGMVDGTLDRELPPLLVAIVTLALGAAPQFMLRRAGPHLPLAGLPSGPELADQLVAILLGGVGARPQLNAGAKRRRSADRR